MWRAICITLALTISLGLTNWSWAQGLSLAERFSIFRGEPDKEPSKRATPTQLHTAKGPAEQGDGRFAVRPVANQQSEAEPTHRTTGGVLPKLGLGKFLPGGIFDRNSRPAVYDEPPEAYDRTGAPRGQRGAAPVTQYPAPETSPRVGSASAPSRPYQSATTGIPESRAPAVQARVQAVQAPIRTARRSPSVTPRSDELTEALRSLGRPTDQTASDAFVTDDVRKPLPEATTDTLPSYLIPVPHDQQATTRSSSSESRDSHYDLGAALRRADRRDEIAAQAAADASTPPAQQVAAHGSAVAQAPQPQPIAATTSSDAPSNSARRPLATRDLAEALAPIVSTQSVASDRNGPTGEVLGEIAANAAPTERKSRPPTPAVAAATRTSVQRAPAAEASRAFAAKIAADELAERTRDHAVTDAQESSAPNLTEQTAKRPSPIAHETVPFDADEPQIVQMEQQFAQPVFNNDDIEAASPSADATSSNSESAPVAIVAQADPTDERQVLFSYQQPLIGSRVEGPRQIIVGREARYQVTLTNSGETGANDVSATVEIPAWADVADAHSSTGIVEAADAQTTSSSPHGDSKKVAWRIYDLPAGTSETLDLMLVPREGRDLQLSVHWTHAAVGSATLVEVQEPMLHMDISGPADVLYGDPQRYTLSLSNPGTGAADDVVIELLPPGGDIHSMVKHPMGSIEPGGRKTIELELTAREAGELAVQATALAAGGLRTETVKNVLCRKPELEIDWRGPDKKYAGSTATYYFRVRNPGTAVTTPVTVELDLPTGAEFVDASDGHALTDDKSSVAWRLSGMRPGEEQFMELHCRLTRPGNNEMALRAKTADGGPSDAKTITAAVIALADLKLEVVDPKGPVPVGEPATYTINIVNRGTTAAHGIDVVALFSTGIEPTSVQGAQHTINDGRIAFRTIDSLPAGRDIVLKIDAKAASEGTHVFRAEVNCQDLDIKLSAEETTRFFVDEYRWDNASNAYAK